MYYQNKKLKDVTTVEGNRVYILDAELDERFKENGLVGAKTIKDILYISDLDTALDDTLEVVQVQTKENKDRYFALAIKKEFVKDVVRDNLPPAVKLSERGNRVWSY